VCQQNAMLLPCVVLVSIAVATASDAVVGGDVRAFAKAVDISAPTTVNTFSCYRQSLFLTAFIRIYIPTGSGQIDTESPNTVRNAFTAGLGVEVYATPQPSGSKMGWQQCDEAYQCMYGNGITVRAIWLQVTSPINWPLNLQANQAFITSFVQRARQLNLRVGIYTNYYDWQQITGNWNGWTAQGSIDLWYWNVNGEGPAGQHATDFGDFVPFGGWTAPRVKQYGQVITVCGTYVNTDVYVASRVASVVSRAESKKKNDDDVTVGLLFADTDVQ